MFYSILFEIAEMTFRAYKWAQDQVPAWGQPSEYAWASLERSSSVRLLHSTGFPIQFPVKRAILTDCQYFTRLEISSLAITGENSQCVSWNEINSWYVSYSPSPVLSKDLQLSFSVGHRLFLPFTDSFRRIGTEVYLFVISAVDNCSTSTRSYASLSVISAVNNRVNATNFLISCSSLISWYL
jgi:hypothetical protein